MNTTSPVRRMDSASARAARTAGREASVFAQVQHYRRERRQRLRTTANGARHQYSHDQLAEIVSLAAAWGPYGGPSSEEVYVRFGLSLAQFFDRLRDAVTIAPCDTTTLDSIHAWYPFARPIG
ncbi:hypothetical protein O4328_44055 [Rhodococcus opacus]|uniref:DUF3263 domain-containing protein n=1 Tax=Rhodococcus opacus TaxID=37919 RepID=A0AAX3YSF9_RHOOP|nr:hypothetical protein [Rhodococcus opacus]MCZ4590514.1 hypothetical protein [Rhodococcus opacus]WLF52221.1 hypothetical protein Q5707_43230 [Rhodococcus opacus]